MKSYDVCFPYDCLSLLVYLLIASVSNYAELPGN